MIVRTKQIIFVDNVIGTLEAGILCDNEYIISAEDGQAFKYEPDRYTIIETRKFWVDFSDEIL